MLSRMHIAKYVFLLFSAGRVHPIHLIQNQNFYVVCELAQSLIKSRAQTQSWPLSSYPGKVKLPSDILRPLPSSEATNEVCSSQVVCLFETFHENIIQVLKTVYLPPEFNSWFQLGGAKVSLAHLILFFQSKTYGYAGKKRKGTSKTESNVIKDQWPCKVRPISFFRSKKSPKLFLYDRRPRKKRNSDEAENESAGEGDDDDVEMDDATPTKFRKPRKDDLSDDDSKPKLSRAERLSARTLAKVD